MVLWYHFTRTQCRCYDSTSHRSKSVHIHTFSSARGIRILERFSFAPSAFHTLYCVGVCVCLIRRASIATLWLHSRAPPRRISPHLWRGVAEMGHSSSQRPHKVCELSSLANPKCNGRPSASKHAIRIRASKLFGIIRLVARRYIVVQTGSGIFARRIRVVARVKSESLCRRQPPRRCSARNRTALIWSSRSLRIARAYDSVRVVVVA